MTGFGEEHCQEDGLAVAVEVRTINSRYLKLSVRTTEGYGSLEPQIETIVRKQIRRGTVQLNVRIDRARSAEDYRIDADVLDGYRRQVEAMQRSWNLSQPLPLAEMLLLPGAVRENQAGKVDTAEVWPMIRRTLESAMAGLGQMRIDEGRVMAGDLAENCRIVSAALDEVERRAPLVVEAYRQRLAERLNKTLTELSVTLDPADVLKEVGLFADRADISEEIVRLRSHVEQFQTIMDSPDCSGRKLEFVAQEMVREGNTIGSKANDVEIARQVIEIKAAVERIREMIQNVE